MVRRRDGSSENETSPLSQPCHNTRMDILVNSLYQLRNTLNKNDKIN